ncbi:MAG: cation transporter [Alphaproteobacteria bacterium]|jgi:Co/Zn/Cd efflux system component|nr:cation transporter [Alphaproteobacteria bacterium]
MSASCCPPQHNRGDNQGSPTDGRFRRVLWIALLVNAAMFVIELATAQTASSAALLADSVDFLGDAINYALSLFVLSLSLVTRARVAWLKGLSMLLFGLWVIGQAAWHAWSGVVPEATTMSVVGALALAANLGVAALLFAHREGDSNRRSVWLCTRNDAIGNVAVLAAAAGVFGTGTGWPDVIVAGVMAVLALHSGWQVVRLAVREMRGGAVAPAPAE